MSATPFREPFVHVVYFWLKNPDSESDRRAFEESLTGFINASAYVKHYHIGRAAGTPREVVDSSYSYSLICTFISDSDQDAYQTEPPHIKFVEDAAHLWDRVQVYDSVR